MANGKAGAPKGNQNARKALKWRDALRYALAQHGRDVEPLEDGEPADMRGLRKIAVKFVNAVDEGESWAMKDLADRIDGKAAQALQLSGPDGGDIPLSGTVVFKKVKSDDA